MKEQDLKQLIAAVAAALMLLLPACAVQTTSDVASANMADTEMERALVSSGFKVRAATTAVQMRQLRRLPDSEFEAVEQNGNTYYLYGDKRENRLYVGDHWAYQAYQGYLKNKDLRKKGAFVWEVRPGDKPNNKTVEVWNGYPPFRSW